MWIPVQSKPSSCSDGAPFSCEWRERNDFKFQTMEHNQLSLDSNLTTCRPSGSEPDRTVGFRTKNVPVNVFSLLPFSKAPHPGFIHQRQTQHRLSGSGWERDQGCWKHVQRRLPGSGQDVQVHRLGGRISNCKSTLIRHKGSQRGLLWVQS